jgi:hypothetical protein
MTLTVGELRETLAVHEDAEIVYIRVDKDEFARATSVVSVLGGLAPFSAIHGSEYENEFVMMVAGTSEGVMIGG